MLEENLGLIDDRGNERGRVLGLGLVVRDDVLGQSAEYAAEAHLLPGDVVIRGVGIQQDVFDEA